MAILACWYPGTDALDDIIEAANGYSGFLTSYPDTLYTILFDLSEPFLRMYNIC